jgi:prephenate dehydrogenase
VRLTHCLVLILIYAATKLGAIVGGQTSCKAPEMAAFEQHLPNDVEIISCHSLHGPGVNSKGQPLVRPRWNDMVLADGPGHNQA